MKTLIVVILALVFISQFCESNVSLPPCQIYGLYGEFPEHTTATQKKECLEYIYRNSKSTNGNTNNGFVAVKNGLKRWDQDKDANGNYHILWGFKTRYTFNRKLRDHIRNSLKDYTRDTCLRFEENPTVKYRSTNKISVISNARTGYCSSDALGRPRWEHQHRTVDLNCYGVPNYGKRTVLHEFMHAIGFHHEQTRYDRDKYITLNYNQMKYHGGWYQYKRVPERQMDMSKTPYDCLSIMHYRAGPVIQYKSKACYFNDKTFSEWDIYELNTQYICPSKMINQKVLKQSMSSYDYAVSKQHTVVINAIENYVKAKFYKNKCYDSEIEKRILQKVLKNRNSLYSCSDGGRPSTTRCLAKNDPKGFKYTGKVSITKLNEECQNWDTNIPHTVNFTPIDGKHHNRCRNPDNDPNGPWCYIKNISRETRPNWRYCSIPTCKNTGATDKKECKKGTGTSYRGKISRTSSGLKCQSWSKPYYFHRPSRFILGFITNARTHSNYCRNWNGASGGPWCYTTDKRKRWQYCSQIPSCP